MFRRFLIAFVTCFRYYLVEIVTTLDCDQATFKPRPFEQKFYHISAQCSAHYDGDHDVRNNYLWRPVKDDQIGWQYTQETNCKRCSQTIPHVEAFFEYPVLQSIIEAIHKLLEHPFRLIQSSDGWETFADIQQGVEHGCSGDSIESQDLSPSSHELSLIPHAHSCHHQDAGHDLLP